MSNYKISKENELKIVRYFKKGKTKKQICNEFDTTCMTIDRILSAHNVSPTKMIKYDKASKEKAQEMALNGASDVEISAETGISLNLASQYVKRVEKEIEQIAEDSLLVRAIPLEKTRYIVINGTSYTDITDFVAGI